MQPLAAFTASWIAPVFAANKRALRVSLAIPASQIWPIFGRKCWGPVLFQALSKSGGAAFHGEGYLYARNSALNSQDSFLNSQGIAKTDAYQYYPGGNVGGPVIIPGTKFNHNRNKLFFWFGYEYMRQQPSGTLWQTFVPTAQMRTGDFSPASLGSLPSNVTSRWSWLAVAPCSPADNRSSCGGLSFPNGIIPQGSLDPNSLALLKLYPKANVDPASHGGNNFQYLDTSPQNRWEQTEKIDYAISDNTKVTVSYAFQKETDLHPVQVWWAPSFSLPYPSPLVAPTTANVIMRCRPGQERGPRRRSGGREGIAANVAYDPKAANYRSEAATAAASGANCVFESNIDNNNAVQLTKDIASAMPNAKIFAPDGDTDPTFFNPTQGGIPTSIDPRVFITVATLDPSAYPPSGQAFFKTYQAKYGTPVAYAIYGYESMALMLDAIKRATNNGSASASARR